MILWFSFISFPKYDIHALAILNPEALFRVSSNSSYFRLPSFVFYLPSTLDGSWMNEPTQPHPHHFCKRRPYAVVQELLNIHWWISRKLSLCHCNAPKNSKLTDSNFERCNFLKYSTPSKFLWQMCLRTLYRISVQSPLRNCWLLHRVALVWLFCDMVVQRCGPQISGIFANTFYANTSLNFLYPCIRIAHHSLTALNWVEHVFSSWLLLALACQDVGTLVRKMETGRHWKGKAMQICKQIWKGKELQFSVLTDLYENQPCTSFVFIHSALSKEEKSQLQQSNTSRGANRSNEWHQKIEKGVADAKIKHVLKKRSGICLSCRSKTYHLKSVRNTCLPQTLEVAPNLTMFYASRLAPFRTLPLHSASTSKQPESKPGNWQIPAIPDINRTHRAVECVTGLCRGSFSTSKVTVRIRADAVR